RPEIGGPRTGGDDRDRPGAPAVQPAGEARQVQCLRGHELMTRLRIGSRGSQLALWQAHHISDLLRADGHEIEMETIKTTADKILDGALANVGTKGMFTQEIEEALAEARGDLGVQS